MRTVSFKKLAKEEGKLERSIKQEGKKKAAAPTATGLLILTYIMFLLVSGARW